MDSQSEMYYETMFQYKKRFYIFMWSLYFIYGVTQTIFLQIEYLSFKDTKQITGDIYLVTSTKQCLNIEQYFTFVCEVCSLYMVPIKKYSSKRNIFISKTQT